MGASPSNGTPLFRFSGRFIPISRPTPINAGRGALRRPQRLCERCVLCGPQYLITGAMTLSEMAVLAMDEILLRTEISGRGEEGLGVGRPNGPGAGAAATSAALPHDAARLHFGTGPARVRPRQARPSRMIPRDFASERDAARVRPRQARPSRMTPRGATSPRRRKMRFHCVINLESRRGARRDPFVCNELRSSPGLSWRLQARREAGADTFPVLAHHLPLKIYISVMSLSASQGLHFRNVPVHLSASTFP